MVSQQPLYLALDQGGGSSRALVVDAAGRVLAQARVAVATRHPHPGWVEQDPQALVASLRRAADDALGQLPVPMRDQLVAWGLVCQRASLVCWHRRRRTPLTPVLSWQDVRGADALALSSTQRRQLHQLSGLYPSAHQGASKFRWCLDHCPVVKRAASRGDLVMSPLAGYLMAALTGFSGAPAVDGVSAQRTLLWGQGEGDWHPALLETFGLKRAWFPTLQPNDAPWGNACLGGQTLPARFLGGDQSAALYAGGAPAPDEVRINLGTGAFATLPLDTLSLDTLTGEAPHTHPTRLLHSLILERGGRRHWALEGTVHGAGAALDWLRQDQGLVFDDQRLGEWLQAAARPALFINGVGGLGSPHWRPRLESRFLGPADPAARAVGVLESILFLLQDNLEALAAEAPLAGLRLGGGLAHLDGLAQRLATLSGYPVMLEQAEEATARGLGWLLAHPEDERHRPTPPDQPRPDQPTKGQRYLPQSDPALQRRYRRWRRCMAFALEAG